MAVGDPSGADHLPRPSNLKGAVAAGPDEPKAARGTRAPDRRKGTRAARPPDGKQVVTGFDEKTARLWDVFSSAQALVVKI
jgi:hypothetical protein